MAPGWKAIFAVMGLAFLNVPTFVVLTDGLMGWSYRGIFPGLLLIGFVLLYAFYSRMAWRRNWWLAGVLWPIVILQELIVFMWSVIGYLRHTITWKGRLVTAQITRPNSIEIDQ